MIIGFDISQTGRTKEGCGYFADSLIRQLAISDSENEYCLYRTFGDSYWDPNFDETCEINLPNFRYGLRHNTIEEARCFWQKPPAEIEKQLGFPNIIHANNFFCPIKMDEARIVYTLYDLSFLEHPDWTTEQNRTTCFTGVFNASLYADFIIAISEYSRRHFLKIFPHYPAERIAVVYPASRFSLVSSASKPESLGDLHPEKFWLSVGTLEPRKNHKRLLEAYARLKAHTGKTYPLVLAGGKGWLMEDFRKQIYALGLRQDIVLPGYVDDIALQWLYQNCFATVYPSLFEGFGLPVLEAMSLGAPVITSNSTSIPEIVGTAGLLVDPMQEEEMFQALLRLSSDQVYREGLKQKALQQVKSFSWERTAADVLKLYRKVMYKPKRSATSNYLNYEKYD